MLIKVAEATPKQIDWLVGYCEGVIDEKGFFSDEFCDRMPHHIERNFTTDWYLAGPLMQREDAFPTRYYGAAESRGKVYQCTIRNHYAQGSTAILAAMHCYIKSKLGEEVEVPDRLREKNRLIEKSQGKDDYSVLMSDANLPNYPQDDVKDFGERVSSAIMNANIRKSMHGLGGCKAYKPEDFESDMIPYIDAYLKGDLDSVAVIYAAMRTKELETEGEKSYPSPKG